MVQAFKEGRLAVGGIVLLRNMAEPQLDGTTATIRDVAEEQYLIEYQKEHRCSLAALQPIEPAVEPALPLRPPSLAESSTERLADEILAAASLRESSTSERGGDKTLAAVSLGESYRTSERLADAILAAASLPDSLRENSLTSET